VACRLVDLLGEPRQYAKKVGIQPRTLELWKRSRREHAWSAFQASVNV
jgi:hypothetical protein